MCHPSNTLDFVPSLSLCVCVYVLMQLPGTTPEMNNYDTKIVFNSSRDSFDAPFYVLSFVGGAWLSMATLELTGSPRGVEIVNVTNVQITNCSFRYFDLSLMMAHD